MDCSTDSLKLRHRYTNLVSLHTEKHHPMTKKDTLLDNLLPLPSRLSDEEFFILSLITYLDSALQDSTMSFICRQRGIIRMGIKEITKRLANWVSSL